MTAVFQTPCIIIPCFVDLVNESFEDTPFITNHDAITCYRLTCFFCVTCSCPSFLKCAADIQFRISNYLKESMSKSESIVLLFVTV